MKKHATPAPAREEKHVCIADYIARQAILSKNRRTEAYELLFRSGFHNAFPNVDGNKASLSVLRTGFLDLGLERVTGGRRAYVNCTREMLVSGALLRVSQEQIVVEVLETVPADDEVKNALQILREANFQIALDDVGGKPHIPPLAEWATHIKVDFLAVPSKEDRRLFAQMLGERGLCLLAEKVETEDDFLSAVEQGYHLFQGYFFGKPEILESRAVMRSKGNSMLLLQEVLSSTFDLDRIEEIVKRDVSLVHGLLRYINSALFALQNPVSGISDALLLLGRQRVRNWVMLIALTEMADKKPPELMVTTLVRALFCERMAKMFGLQDRGSELFMCGLLSSLDVLLGQPMKDVVQTLLLEPAIEDALVKREGPLGPPLQLAELFEKADWKGVAAFCSTYSLNASRVPAIYQEALHQADTLWQETSG